MRCSRPTRTPSALGDALCERLRRCLTIVREGGLLGQLKTRRVYRVVLGYAVGAWVILQICAWGLRGLGAPVWAPHLLLVLLVAGLGAAALGGWAVDRRAIGKSLLPRQTARRVAFVAAAMLPSLLVAEYFHLTRTKPGKTRRRRRLRRVQRRPKKGRDGSPSRPICVWRRYSSVPVIRRESGMARRASPTFGIRRRYAACPAVPPHSVSGSHWRPSRASSSSAASGPWLPAA